MKNCLFKLGRRTVRVSACAFMAVAVCTNKSWAADVVPDVWNTAPMKAGAYLESFETLPAWANLTGSSLLTETFPTTGISGLPVRANDWFDTSVNVLELSTDGTVLTNELENSSSGAVDFENEPVYVDMRVRFNPMDEEPDAALLTNCKLALFVNSDTNLVVVRSDGASTNTTELVADKWYQVTVVMSNNLCDVKLDDENVFTGLTLKTSGTDNELDAVSFHGSGYVDNLYVSHGAPTYAVVGPTVALPAGVTTTLPVGGNVPSDEEQTKRNVWLSGQSGLTSLSLNMTQDKLNEAYLVDADITGDAGPVTIDFGISAIDVVSPTSLKITAKLSLDSSVKTGTINGRIQLLGKTTKNANWATLSGAITPSVADFDVNGEAVYDFTIPVGYKIFKPTIVPLGE
ncbi:MAG: hypothetical protein PF904_18505 [Kiritimatiellae bacterium]|jgi:hypothetical protein|nr:hypothetical protein [Kiritimatiellia bacterium]